MARKKLNTQAVGLDAGLGLIHWLTGREDMHYGLWDGLDVCAANLGAAQVAYSERLLSMLPKGSFRILDIGGGAGETAKRLIALGHNIDIVVPSPLLAERCRTNAPEATVYEARFEDAALTGPYDLCLFSESFQYIPLAKGLAKCLTLLAEDGHILLADCFRSEAYSVDKMRAKVGGGHRLGAFRETLEGLPLTVEEEHDVTEAAAPSVEIEQALFNVIGDALTRIDAELQEKRPARRWAIQRLLRLVLSERSRGRLKQRLMEQTRNRETFAEYNRYLMMRLARA
ncbi:class I SAM-dependent methyltransferase [Aestuariibius sp. 2305UL40-4]|uniref:class I SAM-dependent methyltransferase n=1 Tax=Aestuariibius violaceus TaxID=3234132 RepID=UPI00345ED93E